jgi:hypothetical protein
MRRRSCNRRVRLVARWPLTPRVCRGRARIRRAARLPPNALAAAACAGRRTARRGPGEQCVHLPRPGARAILSGLAQIPDEALYEAAKALAACVGEDRLREGAIYPDVAELRQVSATVAAAVIRFANTSGAGRPIAEDRVQAVVRDSMWFPDYVRIIPALARRGADVWPLVGDDESGDRVDRARQGIRPVAAPRPEGMCAVVEADVTAWVPCRAAQRGNA